MNLDFQCWYSHFEKYSCYKVECSHIFVVINPAILNIELVWWKSCYNIIYRPYGQAVEQKKYSCHITDQHRKRRNSKRKRLPVLHGKPVHNPDFEKDL